MTNVETLTNRLVELRAEAETLKAAKSREDLHREVENWLTIARSLADGSSRFVLGGRADGPNLASVMFEDLLGDEDLPTRLVARLTRQGFGELSDKQRGARLAKIDAEITKVSGELREARKAQAIAELEAKFAAETAA
jgi:hypothetical protein